ncbi:MAG: radical SAM protein, partial [Pirellulales bacterium]|nr:radical SAM protein [Pirellulales bacterium]
MPGIAREDHRFLVEIIKPSHYDDDGYVIQWQRAFVPSNSLACLYSLVQEAAQRRVLGPNVAIEPRLYDESHTVIPTRRIIARFQANGNRGIVFLAGVQTNQFPRAADLAAEFRAAGIPVVIGGFHVSGCLAMLPQLPEELKAVLAAGTTLFAGEAEGRMAALLDDAFHGRLKPVYNYLGDLPDLQGQPTPILPREVASRSMFCAPFDAGRGCPFQCSFCTIINVQGRKSRYRTPDDVEAIVRANAAQGVSKFFVTDDNFARNKNWEPILDRLIELREKEGFRIRLLLQVDTLCHRIPGFIEKAARAGCNTVFIGLENINPESLMGTKKRQNKIWEYREMLQAWRSHKVMTWAGYI